MAQCTTRWFLSLQITLYLFLIFVQGNEDAEDAYKSGRGLVLENFLPINLASAIKEPLRREKRDVEGSGEDESAFSELKESDDVDNSTQNAFAKMVILEKEPNNNLTILEEGSGEVVDESSEERWRGAAIIDDSEILTTSEDTVTETQTVEVLTSTEMIFDRSEDFDAVKTEVAATVAEEITTIKNEELEITTEYLITTSAGKETTTSKPPVTTEEISTIWATERVTVPVVVHLNAEDITRDPFSKHETTTVFQEAPEDTQTVINKITTLRSAEETPTVVSTVSQEVSTQSVITKITTTKSIRDTTINPSTTENLPILEKLLTTLEPVIEEAFKETRMDEKLEASPGNILQKENLSLGADPQLISNTRLIDSEVMVHSSSAEPKRLGAYIVIGLILLSFSSLVGYITFRKRMNRKRQELESNQESNDTEKALLSLSDYKDSSELEENHLKNNEITPIVVKSNSQINKFEKNTNFSSPKNLNTIANEKNVEKDNVLKSTAENLTQVIIEDSPKEVEENVPNTEKLIVKTRIDQDSIPKKPIIINRSSTGYIPIPQDN